MSAPVVILSGAGSLPLLLADALTRRGQDVCIVAFRGFAGKALQHRADAHLDLLDIPALLTFLERLKPRAVTLAGAVSRPHPAVLAQGLSFWRHRNDVKTLLSQGDDHLLRGALTFLEEKGFCVLGIRDLAPELLARPGLHGAMSLGEAENTAIHTGFALLKALSPFDMGQACIASGERILAVEGPEGTDAMLTRTARLIRPLFLKIFPRQACNAVLIKTAKIGQDIRIDLPAIGPRTVCKAHKAGLSGIALGAGETLILEETHTLSLIRKLGLFLVALPAEDQNLA
jgi:UDP-2,3-diacylglucosamine hydrolase